MDARLAWLVTLSVLGVFLYWQLFHYKTPEPQFKVLKSDGAFQIRQYPSILVAQVEVSGERYAAINQGFRELASFIFGNNHAKQSIAMTAPVTQSAAKIAMTAPVMQQSHGGIWLVRFVMPQQYTLATLPVPNSTRIKIIEIPAKKYVVLRFSGFNSDANLAQQQKKLDAYIKDNHLSPLGDVIAAFYNPPWILPFFRRNEVMREIH